MKKYIALIIVLVLVAASLCGYRMWKLNQPDKWEISLSQPVEDETVTVYYDKMIDSETGYFSIWNKNDFPIDVYFILQDGSNQISDNSNDHIVEKELPGHSQTVGILVDENEKYEVGIHADVAEGTEINLVVQDGNTTIEID